jgi:hypothetical protein
MSSRSVIQAGSEVVDSDVAYSSSQMRTIFSQGLPVEDEGWMNSLQQDIPPNSYNLRVNEEVCLLVTLEADNAGYIGTLSNSSLSIDTVYSNTGGWDGAP